MYSRLEKISVRGKNGELRFRCRSLYHSMSAFNVLTVLLAVFIGYRTLDIWTRSVRESSLWSHRSALLLQLTELVAAVNAPGNDVFESGDADGEGARLKAAWDCYDIAMHDLRGEFSQDVSTELRQIFDVRLNEINGNVENIRKSAELIFSQIAIGNSAGAGRHMAAMDQHFARTLSDISELGTEAQTLRDNGLREESAHLVSLKGMAVVAFAAIVLMIVFLSLYGHKLSTTMFVAEAAIAASEETLRGVLDTAADAIITVNDQGRIESFNPAAERMFGFFFDEAIGRNISRLMPNTNPQPESDEAQNRLAWIVGRDQEAVGRRRNGSEFPIEFSVSELHLAGRRRYTGIIRDISARKADEQRLEEQASELAAQAIVLREAQERADLANRAKSEFLANMSHEIRTPMTAILGYTDTLVEESWGRKGVLDSLGVIKRNGEHLLEIINGILDLSKIEAGKLTIERIACSPLEILADIQSLMKVRTDNKGLELRCEFRGPIPETVVTDPTRLRQILINLVGNAIKFTEQGSITVRTELLKPANQPPQLEFNVIDTGVGMSTNQVESLFQPFSQADSSTTRRFGGTGLGLSISHRLARMLDGDVVVSRSVVGEGTTFQFCVAIGNLDGVKMIDNPAEAITLRQNVLHETSEVPVRLDGYRILLAEDGKDNQRLVSYLLAKMGAEVTIADNGEIAAEKTLESMRLGHPFDVVLMDMQMPVLDGYGAVRVLRSSGFRRPIIALTAHAMPADRQRCLDAGCDDYATKPIDRRNLVAMIARHKIGSDAAELQASAIAGSAT